MQKFVVVKNMAKPSTHQEATTQLLQVKMCGYLKKKRKVSPPEILLFKFVRLRIKFLIAGNYSVDINRER